MQILYIYPLLFILEMKQNLGAYITAEFKDPRNYFRNTEVHTNELYLSVSLSFQDIESLNYLAFYLNTDMSCSKSSVFLVKCDTNSGNFFQ